MRVRVYPIGAITKGQDGEQLAEIGDMIAEGAVAFSDDGNGIQSAGMTRIAMDYIKRFDATLIAHCEDESLAGHGVVNEGVVSTRMGLPGIPAAAEETMVARDIALAELTGCRLHLAHLSTAGSVALVRDAKARGVRVTCEVTPHHLFLDEDALVGLRHEPEDEPAAAHRGRPRGARRRRSSTARWTASPPTMRRTRRTRRSSSSSSRRSARPASRRRSRS